MEEKKEGEKERGEMIVNHQVKIPFSIRDYCDEVLCDIIPMEVGHILLGRSWQFDKKAIHNGLTNEITLTHGSKNFKLVPLTPLQMALGSSTNKTQIRRGKE